MPIVITFDISGASAGHHNQLQSLFERFGWENLGGTSYRYPQLGSSQPTEDWFNHVVPALMLFRAYALKYEVVKKFSLDVQSSTGFSPNSYGTAPLEGEAIKLYQPNSKQFGKKNLVQWLNDIKYPY